MAAPTYIEGSPEYIEVREKRKREMQFTPEEKLIVFRMLICYAHRHGYKHGWAANKFRAFFKSWPNGFGAPPPLEPSPEILNWIKGQQIRPWRS